jgi:hypothetical protein
VCLQRRRGRRFELAVKPRGERDDVRSMTPQEKF